MARAGQLTLHAQAADSNFWLSGHKPAVPTIKTYDVITELLPYTAQTDEQKKFRLHPFNITPQF
jgi:hypothetical protein